MTSSLLSPAHIGIPREGGKDVAKDAGKNAAIALSQINVALGCRPDGDRDLIAPLEPEHRCPFGETLQAPLTERDEARRTLAG